MPQLRSSIASSSRISLGGPLRPVRRARGSRRFGVGKRRPSCDRMPSGGRRSLRETVWDPCGRCVRPRLERWWSSRSAICGPNGNRVCSTRRTRSGWRTDPGFRSRLIPDLEAHAVEVYGSEGHENLPDCKVAAPPRTHLGREVRRAVRPAPGPSSQTVEGDACATQSRARVAGAVGRDGEGDRYRPRRSVGRAALERVCPGGRGPRGGRLVGSVRAGSRISKRMPWRCTGPRVARSFGRRRRRAMWGQDGPPAVPVGGQSAVPGPGSRLDEATESSREPASTRPVVQQPATRPPIVSPKRGVQYAPATPMETIESMMHNNPRLKQCIANSG